MSDQPAPNICGTCKHFGKIKVYYDDQIDEVESRFHVCNRIGHLNDAGKYDEPLKEFPDPAGVEDGSGYHAALIVAEDFGCILWEPKS